MNYFAIYMPESENKISKGWFQSLEQVEDYISEFVCKECLADVERRWYLDKEKVPVESIIDTYCGAEWMVLQEEELDPKSYEEFLQEKKC